VSYPPAANVKPSSANTTRFIAPRNLPLEKQPDFVELYIDNGDRRVEVSGGLMAKNAITAAVLVGDAATEGAGRSSADALAAAEPASRCRVKHSERRELFPLSCGCFPAAVPLKEIECGPIKGIPLTVQRS
jgi:hypothetical protein